MRDLPVHHGGLHHSTALTFFTLLNPQVLKQLSPYKNNVVATGGGAVLRPMNWSYMQQGIVVWLKGSPSLHAKRVAKDGLEKRPLLADAGTSGDDLYSAALAKVTSMLADRSGGGERGEAGEGCGSDSWKRQGDVGSEGG